MNKFKVIVALMLMSIGSDCVASDRFVILGNKAYNINTFVSFEMSNIKDILVADRVNYSILVKTNKQTSMYIKFKNKADRDANFNKLLNNFK